MWQRLDHEFTPQTWDAFVAQHSPLSGRFLQSWEWGEIQGAHRWVRTEGQKGIASVIMKTFPVFGSYAYCPRGPIVTGSYDEAFRGLSDALGLVIFLRADLPVAPEEKIHLHKTIDLQPAHTWVTDLTSSEELFFAMHSKTRYNIRTAERHGVSVSFDAHAFDAVWPLFEQTSGRGKFRLHTKTHYALLLQTLKSETCRAHLAVASLEGKPVAANILVDFADVRTYLHGASSYAHRSLMAPHLLHWESLKDACARGLQVYDWWGVAPANGSHHPWAGISRFKRSFPGRELCYPGTYDLVKKPLWYTLYGLARRLRRVA
ncbi:peptidoglycan bridge formation glycyltransferase FemA/FemB family protein [Candidatus Uhrbacteria bacterium]|nr:peptidoglycan bridge formation glycyltransferase FemA/FemB family protein [Candidatus Uhrbacteria bacterium]